MNGTDWQENAFFSHVQRIDPMKNFILQLLPPRVYLQYRWWRLVRRQPQLVAQNKLKREGLFHTVYGMLGFDELKTIFVHVPKCGGVSINRALFGNLGGGHTSLEEYLTVFSPSEFLSFFKFAFVRNPWDRVVSAYFFLKNGGLNQWDKDWFARELSEYETFESFVRQWLNKKI